MIGSESVAVSDIELLCVVERVLDVVIEMDVDRVRDALSEAVPEVDGDAVIELVTVSDWETDRDHDELPVMVPVELIVAAVSVELAEKVNEVESVTEVVMELVLLVDSESDLESVSDSEKVELVVKDDDNVVDMVFVVEAEADLESDAEKEIVEDPESLKVRESVIGRVWVSDTVDERDSVKDVESVPDIL